MRLNRYLAACGIGSRRACDALIAAGRVRVGDAVGRLEMRVQPGDVVQVDGRRVALQSTAEVWMLHKPAGVLSTVRDPQGRPTVADLARRAGIASRVFPVGRLDRETTGLLLLTTDGDLAHRILHPSHGVEKEYVARVASPPAAATLARLSRGVELDDGPTAPCTARLEVRGADAFVTLVLHEGRKRQVRRMLEAVGHPVLALQRVRIGPLRLGDLAPGALRPLGPGERAALEAHLPAAGGDPAQ